MKPTKFMAVAKKYGTKETCVAGQIFHAQDFPNKLFLLKKGYVKRYQARKFEQKVLELIYGPGHIISLSQLYKMLFNVSQNQDNFIYVYQAMTDIEIVSVDAERVVQELEKDALLYKDFFYESGIKLRSNILRLASNSFKDKKHKVAHQLVGLAYEFGEKHPGDSKKIIVLPLPQTATDMAEQLNISHDAAEQALESLVQNGIIERTGDMITILNIEFLKDIYN